MHHRPAQFTILERLLAVLILPMLGACNFTVQQPTEDPNFVVTAAAATIAANSQQQTIDAMQVLLTSQAETLQAPTNTPTPTEPAPPPTLEVPTETPVPTLTEVLPSPTPEPPQVIMLTADIDTRCRQGPSTAFNTISFITVGQQAEVIGRNPERTWWLIRDPQGKFGNCWVWGETTRVLGDPSGVPILEPPPTPTSASASFTASFANIHNCGGVAMATFRVVNNGTLEFRSSQITVRDLTNNVILAGPEMSNEPFQTSANGCLPAFKTLPAGSSAWVMKGMGILPPSGTRGRGIIVLCTLANLGGQCLEQRVNFNFP